MENSNDVEWTEENRKEIKEKYNQFVWIPVHDTRTMFIIEDATLEGVTTSTHVYSNFRVKSNQNYPSVKPGDSSGIKEPEILLEYDVDAKYYRDVLGYANMEEMSKDLVEEYNSIYESIKNYGGFYVGRYEISGNVDNPKCVEGGTVITDQNWYNLRKACINLINNSDVSSTMIYGNQFDEIMNWLIETGDKTEEQINNDSTDWGNYKDSSGEVEYGIKQTAGFSELWKANNIYDLAGNCREWTQEAYNSNRRMTRGGNFNYSGLADAANVRNNNNPEYSYKDVSSRAVIYIK